MAELVWSRKICSWPKNFHSANVNKFSSSEFKTFLHIFRVFKEKNFQRHVSSLFRHFQVRKLILVPRLYSGDVLETQILS